MKKEPTQPRKAEHKNASAKGNKPAAEVTMHRETQPRSANKDSGKSKQAPKGHDESMHPENFNRFGTNFVSTQHVKKGL